MAVPEAILFFLEYTF